MLADIMYLFDVLTKGSMTNEKTPKIDLKAVKDSYKNTEIDEIAYYNSEYNIADPLTKTRTF